MPVGFRRLPHPVIPSRITSCLWSNTLCLMALLPYSQSDSKRFVELANLYLACRAAFRDISIETQALPVAGSRAERDITTLEARQPPIAEGAHGLISKESQRYLYAASEHIGSLAALYGVEEVMLSPLVLARSAIEHSAHAVWIVGDASSTAEDRLARAYLELIFGYEQAKMHAGRLSGRGGKIHVARSEFYRAVKEDARATFEPPYQDEHGKPLLNGQQIPSPENIVLETNRLSSQPLTDDEMQGTYGFLSNFVHPTVYALQELFEVREVNGQQTPELARDLEFHNKLAKLVVGPFYQALVRLDHYHGWNSQHFNTLNAELQRLLPTIFNGSEQAPLFRSE